MARHDYFSTDEARSGLKRKTVRGGLATGAAQAVSVAIRLVSIPILTRLLDADDFGVVQMALVFTGVGQLLIDSGFSAATVQRPTLTRQQSTNMFWLATGVGASLALATLLAAWPIGLWYGRDDVAAVVAVLAAPFALSGMTIQHQALMRRAMRLPVLAAVQVTATVLAQSSAIAAAWAWQSHWALVLGLLVQSAAVMSLTWLASEWRPGWFRRGAGAREMARFGASLSLARFVNYVSRVADRAIVGSFLGAQQLGYYQVGYKAITEPIQSVNGPMNAVMVPALSRLVDEPKRYAKAYFAALRLICAVGLPLVAVAGLDAERLVPLALGQKWTPSVPIFIALLPAAAFSTIKPMFSWCLVAQGRGKDYVRWHLIASASALTGVGVGLLWGAVGVAWGFSLSRWLIFPIGVAIAFHNSPLTTAGLARAIAPVLACVSVAAAANWIACSIAPEWFAAPAVWSAALLVCVTLVSYGLAVWLSGLHRVLKLPARNALSDA